MKKRNRAPSPVSAVIESIASSMGKREMYDFAAICGNWRKIVGQAMSDISSPARLARKTLTIDVAQPVWADSMGYMKNEIIGKVNHILGRNAVAKIRMSIQKGAGEAGKDKPQPDEPAAPLPLAVIREVEDAVKYIPDSQLRSTFKRIILKDVGKKYSVTSSKKKS